MLVVLGLHDLMGSFDGAHQLLDQLVHLLAEVEDVLVFTLDREFEPWVAELATKHLLVDRVSRCRVHALVMLVEWSDDQVHPMHT